MYSFTVLYLLLTLYVKSSSASLQEEIDYLKKFYEASNADQSWSITWEVDENDLAKQLSLLQSQAEYLSWVDGSLTKINLNNIGLSSEVPDGIEKLSNLENLTLSDNQISSIPNLALNTKLEYLDVSYNSLKDYGHTFPNSLIEIKLNNNSIEKDISEFLGKITETPLTTLDLSGNKLSGSISAITLLNSASFTSVNLAHNELEGDLPTIRSGAFTKLDVSYNKLTGDFPDVLKISDANANTKCNMFNCESLTNEPSKYNIKECFCPVRGNEAVVESNSIKCSTCSDGTMANKWVRFSFWDDVEDDAVEDYTCSTPTTGCVDCMFPRNCVGGACATGSTGPTCETCIKDYRIIGGKCEKCIDSKVPIPALLLIVILVVIAGYGVFLSGLNILAATMIKQLFSFLQFYTLTMDIKATWPYVWAEVGNIFKVSMINSEAFDLDCITSMSTIDLYYIHWTSAVVWPLILTIVVLTIDKTYATKIDNLERKPETPLKAMEMGDLKKKQAGTRRVWIMFGLIMFVPMTALSLRMYACDSWSPVSVTVKYNDAEDVVWNQWFYDNSVSCNETSLQGVNFLATMLLVGEFGVIVFLFLILFRLWRFDLKDKQSDLFGALYESYNDKGLFCEPILLLRKFILMMTTQVTYIPAAYSAGANSALSFAWLLFILIRQPYISSTDTGRMVAFLNNWCNLFEIAATILITLIQVYALVDGIVDFATLTTVNMDGLSYTILVLSSLLVIVWVVMFIIVLIRVTRSDLKDLKRTSTANKNSRRETVVSNPAATARVSPSEFSDGDALEMAPIVDGDLEC